MIFENLPEGVLAAGSDIILHLSECDPEKITEVRIEKDGQTLGTKRLRGEAYYTVNVACYLQDTLDIEPYYAESGIGFKEMPSWLGYFSVKATEYKASEDGPTGNALWIETEKFPYTAGTRAVTVLTPLMGIEGDLEICPDDVLVIPILLDVRYAWGRLSVTCPEWSQFITPYERGEEGVYRMYAYFVNPKYLNHIFECRFDQTFELLLEVGGVEPDLLFTKRIAIREMPVEGVRLCWVNEFGTTDYFTFSPVQKISSSYGKTRIKGNRGYQVSAVDREKVFTVTTPLLTPEKLACLSGILSSPRVWHLKETGAEISQIDIVTHKIDIDSDVPGTVQVSFRYSQER